MDEQGRKKTRPVKLKIFKELRALHLKKHAMESDEEMLNAGTDVVDEFTGILNMKRTPKILITTSRHSHNSTIGERFILNLVSMIPNARYRKLGTCDLKKLVQYANEKHCTSMIVVCNKRHGPESLRIIGLPVGPHAHFKLSRFTMPMDIENHGTPTNDKPDLVLTNFTTSLGHRLQRMIQSLFPQNPVFPGRRVVTFHKRRDIIIFRHHNYIFETKEGKQTESTGNKSKDERNPEERTIASLQARGPKFCLKLISIQRGTRSSEEYERYKAEMDTCALDFQDLRI